MSSFTPLTLYATWGVTALGLMFQAVAVGMAFVLLRRAYARGVWLPAMRAFINGTGLLLISFLFVPIYYLYAIYGLRYLGVQGGSTVFTLRWVLAGFHAFSFVILAGGVRCWYTQTAASASPVATGAHG